MIGNGAHMGVLIVGAGPSGLMMAAQLLRLGIQPVIIDQKLGPVAHANALVLQARSLEIYRQMGIADRVINNGNPVKGVRIYAEGEEKATFKLTETGNGQTAYPFLFLYQQYKNEQVLLEYLTTHCCPVYWNTRLLSLKQKEGSNEVTLQNGEYLLNITCNWLIGADGAHSGVRKQLHTGFNGDTYAHNFFLADVELDNAGLSADFVQLYLSRYNFAGFLPMPEKNNYRIVGNLPKEFDPLNNSGIYGLIPLLGKTTGQQINIVKSHWFTTYRLHHRMANRFRQQNCFLIGDAAHIHSPVGGQGMNTGLQDAYNLAWKLAGVVNGQFKSAILDSYSEERMPVARALLSSTDRAFSLIMSKRWYSGLIKKYVLPRLLQLVWGKQAYREYFFKQISQIGINYRNSNINLHLSHAEKIKAGDRLPYMKLYDEKRQEETDLHQWCSKPGFTLIVFGKFDEMFLFNIARWITMKFPNLLNFYYLPPTGKNLDIFSAFEVNPQLQKAIIVRPDMHIGFMNDAVDLKLMYNYLRNVIGVRG